LTLTQEGTPAEWVEPARDGWGKIISALALHLAEEDRG
jgi:hypothetical protein